MRRCLKEKGKERGKEKGEGKKGKGEGKAKAEKGKAEGKGKKERARVILGCFRVRTVVRRRKRRRLKKLRSSGVASETCWARTSQGEKLAVSIA